MSTQPPTNPIGGLINDVAKMLRRRFEEMAKTQKLTLPQWRVLAQLARADEISQTALATLIDTDPMTVSGILDRLEKRALVERIPDPTDSRAKLVRATDKSRALVDKTKGVGLAMYERALAGIDEHEREVLHSALSKIRANLRDMDITTQETSK